MSFILRFLAISVLVPAVLWADEDQETQTVPIQAHLELVAPAADYTPIPQSRWSTLYKLPTALYLGLNLFSEGTSQLRSAGGFSNITGLDSLGSVDPAFNLTAGLAAASTALFTHGFLKAGFTTDGEQLQFKRPNWVVRTTMSYAAGLGFAHLLPTAVAKCTVVVSALASAF